jgi:hypothetical protein
MSFPGNQRKIEVVRCRICHSVITDVEGIYQSPSLYAVACQVCASSFSREDLEMMMGLFYLYGGYFGEKGREVFCLETILDSIGNEIPIDFDNLESINQRVMHVALLHGLGPSEFNQILKEYIESEDGLIHHL